MYKLDRRGLLDVRDQGLTSLDELPSGIKMLYCFRNKLESLPVLPEGLVTLLCYSNNIKYLPVLPNSLKEFVFHDNPLKCLVPIKFLGHQGLKWTRNVYTPYINSYKGQKNILTRDPLQIKELMLQAEILPKIRKEFAYLIDSTELNLL